MELRTPNKTKKNTDAETHEEHQESTDEIKVKEKEWHEEKRYFLVCKTEQIKTEHHVEQLL